MNPKAIAAAVSLVLAPVSAHALVHLGAKASYWMPSLSGDLGVGVSGFSASADVKDDFGFSDENAFVGELFADLGNHHLSLSGTRFDYSGTRRLGTLAQINNSLEYTMVDFAYQWDAIDLENCLAGFSLGPVLQLKYLDGDLSLGNLAGTGVQLVSESFQIPMPMVGVGAHVGLLANLLEARGKAVGMAYGGNSIVDVSAEVSFTPLPFIEILGGYRHLAVDVEAKDVFGGRGDLLLDFRQSGPYVGVALKVGI
jgi:hypothetical protein